MKKCFLFFLAFLLLFPSFIKGSQQKDPQIIANIDELRGEISRTKNEIEAAQKKDSELAGGLVKALIGLRIEILKTNEALLQQRILALESGAPIKLQVSATTPDEKKVAALEQEIQLKQNELALAKKDMERYSGGLVLAMKSSTVATLENSIAMLDQQRLIARYGIFYDTNKSKTIETETSSGSKKQKSLLPAEEIFSCRILSKGILKQKYNEFLSFDIELTPATLKKPTRSIKGVIIFCDLFGETRFQISGTFNDKIVPGTAYVKRGIGTDYNQFNDEHNWLKNVDVKDMTFRFRVISIIYEDGEREDY